LPAALATKIREQLQVDEHFEPIDDHSVRWSIPWRQPYKDAHTLGAHISVRRDPILIQALRKAHAMLEHDATGRPALLDVPSPRYERRLARLAFLSPTLQAAIVNGRQPPTLTLAKIIRGKVPAGWKEQEEWAKSERGSSLGDKLSVSAEHNFAFNDEVPLHGISAHEPAQN